MNKKAKLLYALLCLTASVWAQDPADGEFAAVPPSPDIPDPIQSGQAIEPEVTIIRTEESVVEEYRINGQLYMVKITPSVGRPYYLIDTDGDGNLESRRSTLGSGTVVPQWVIFEW